MNSSQGKRGRKRRRPPVPEPEGGWPVRLLLWAARIASIIVQTITGS